MKYLSDEGNFDVDAFKHTIDIMILSQELIVSNSSYPRDKIEDNSNRYRPLGLGYANLGALLMACGLPYDSDAGRAYAASITAVMTGQAYLASANISEKIGPFTEFTKNKDPMLNVIKKHKKALEKIDSKVVPKAVYEAAGKVWDEAYKQGEKYGFRNAQVTVLAPTGTIGFMMDCDTTGIEPELALVKYKSLSGGGNIKLVNKTITRALKNLGYKDEHITEIVDYTQRTGTIESSQHIKEENLPVFDCAFKSAAGKRYIHYMGHIKMMAAVQPFITGAISKTVNVPEQTTINEIVEIYHQAWKLKLKAIAIYRDNSKGQQILSTSSKSSDKIAIPSVAQPTRFKLPIERMAITHKFNIGGHEGYLTVGMYENGMPGEIFLVMAKEGSTISGLMDAFATAVSMALQYGVPLEVLTSKFSYTRFEPSGYTGNKDIPYATSIMDYIFRWLARKFLDKVPREDSIPMVETDIEQHTAEDDRSESDQLQLFENQEDAPPCHNCGAIMVRSGSCYKCLNCGDTSGCS
jgi:ribonucleoside-diphosphate reductase alpha chain